MIQQRTRSKGAIIRLGLDGAYNSAELAVKGLLVLKIADLPGSMGESLKFR